MCEDFSKISSKEFWRLENLLCQACIISESTVDSKNLEIDKIILYWICEHILPSQSNWSKSIWILSKEDFLSKLPEESKYLAKKIFTKIKNNILKISNSLPMELRYYQKGSFENLKNDIFLINTSERKISFKKFKKLLKTNSLNCMMADEESFKIKFI